MKNYLVIYYSPAAAQEQMANATPEQQAEGMKPWFAWKEKIENNLIDFGAPLSLGNQQDSKGNWTACQNEVSGYTMIKAESLEHAKQLVQDHHHLAWAPNCRLGVYECASM